MNIIQKCAKEFSVITLKECYEYWNHQTLQKSESSSAHLFFTCLHTQPHSLSQLLIPNFVQLQPLPVFTDLQDFSFLQDLQWFIFHVSNSVIITQASDYASCYMNKSSNSQIDISMNCIKLNTLLFYASTCITEAFAFQVHKIPLGS